MKRLFLSITLLAVLFFASSEMLRAQEYVQLNKGAFVLVYAKKVLSSATMQEGDQVYFVSPADIWVNETNIIPKNAVFVGYISMLKMPIKGVNAAFSIKITNIILPQGSVRNFAGTISNGSSDIIGGELTPPASYKKTIHPYKSRLKWSGTTQWIPSGEYEFGEHSAITPTQKMFVVLDEPYKATSSK